MDVAAGMYEGKALHQINMCRLKLQVLYLSDIASVDGTRILLAYYQGKPHRATGRRTCINWPPIGHLPMSWWSQWQHFLARWCGSDLKIANPLGGWYENIEHLTLCSFFQFDNRLIMQKSDGFCEFFPAAPRAKTRFLPQEHPFYDLDLLVEAQVVDVSFRSSYIYVIARSNQNLIPSVRIPRANGLRGLHQNLSPEVQRILGSITWPSSRELEDIVNSIQTGTILGVSDGSVRTREGRASHAWILQSPNGSEITGRGPVDGSNETRTSHRAELQGQAALFVMLSMIAQYFRIIGGSIMTYCDNQAVVNKLQRGWQQWRYRNTKGADSDLQTLLRSTISELEATSNISYKSDWVQSHQDDHNQVASLPRPARLNVRMDQETKEAYALPPQWHTQQFVPVLSSERCAVYISNMKITSRMHSSVLEKWNEQEAKEYMLQRHGIDTASFGSIYWQSMRYALRKFSAHRRAIAVKAIHRHLPTQDKLFKQNRITMTSICPRCLGTAETNEHIFCCPSEEALKQRKADWIEMWKNLHRGRTATIIEQTWRANLQPLLGLPQGESIVDKLVIPHGTVADILQQAISDQTSIGWNKLLLGMGSKLWTHLQDMIDADNPSPPKRNASDWMNTAVHNLLKFSVRCWKKRNEMVHGATWKEQQENALQRAREQIIHLYQNPPELASRYGSIFDVPLAHRLRMPLKAAEHWLSLITHRSKITQHHFKTLLQQHRPMQVHLRNMRCAARQQAKDRLLPSTPTRAASREVQAAVAAMRAKLYAPRSKAPISKHKRPQRRRNVQRHRGSKRMTDAIQSEVSVAPTRCHIVQIRPPLRHHPP